MRSISFAVALTIAALTGGVEAADTDDVLTYQGELTLDGELVERNVNLEFQLHDTATGDTPVGPRLYAEAVPVSDGRFIVDLAFGTNVVSRGPRWLEIMVDGETLSPRQPIIALPPVTFLTTEPTTPEPGAPGTPGTLTPGTPVTEKVAESAPSSLGAAPGEAAPHEPNGNAGASPGAPVAARGTGAPVPPETKVNVEPRIEYASEGWQLNGSKIYYRDGNVGIGLKNPSYSLHVKSGKSRAVFAQTDKQSGTALYGHSKSSSGSGKGVWGVTNSATGYAGFFVGGRNYFSGQVGIGTAQPTEMLTVQGVVQSTEGGFMFPDGTLQTTAGGGGSDGGFWAGDTTTIRNTNTGNVGIGTATPGEKLTVDGTIESKTGGFKFPDGTVQDTAAVGGGGTDTFWGQTGNDISNTNSGNVGIGLATPGQRLSVAGTVESTTGGFMFPDGTVQTSAVLESGGDITGVSAGTGLSGGGETGDVSLAIATDGVTSAHLSRDAASLLEVSGGVIQNVSNRIGINVQVPETKFHVETNSSGDNAAIIGYHKSSLSGLVGVLGQSVSDPGGIGVQAISKGVFGLNYGLWADAEGVGSYAGWFNTDAHVNGKFTALVKQFRIDHPLDPANKYLSHSCVESPDMMNIYNGTVTTNAKGEAWVEMPEWFEALNRDFRYQLTVIGQFAQAIIAEEIEGNRFRIRTDHGDVKVSWQVTGVRHDPVAVALRAPVVEEKSAAERGRYLAPEVYGDPASAGIGYMPSALSGDEEKQVGLDQRHRVGGAR